MSERLAPPPADQLELLKARARLLAKVPEARAAQSLPVLRLDVGEVGFAVPLESLAGVVPLGEVLPVHGGPPWLLGLRALGGRPVSVVDLGAVLGLGAATHAVAALVARPRGLIALAATAADLLQTFDPAALVPAPADLSVKLAPFVRGVGEGGLLLLDLNTVAASLEAAEGSEAR
jgi:chemotaxis signal transduction protein